MKNKFINKFLFILLLTFNLTVMAEDIDLFVGATTTEINKPNVLFIVDNTANWNTAFTNEMAALKDVVDALPVDKFRVGFMMFTETGSGNSGADGAYVRAAIRIMSEANKLKYSAMVSSFVVGTDKGNSGKIGKAMEEAYHYFAGVAPYAGNGKNKTDYTGNISGTTASNAVYALAANALSSKAGTVYSAPDTDSCPNNYVIYISNGAAQDSAADITQAKADLIAVGGSATTIALSPSGSQDNVADEWARFMKQSSLKITSYTVDINKVTTGQGPGWTALLKSIAGVSHGKYFDITATGNNIRDALNAIFSEIQPVDSVFASVSLPVSVNTQGTYLNQVYVGMFKPDQYSKPKWNGNLKQYKLGYVGASTALQLLDADGLAAINNNSGFIAECVRSYWTPTTLDTYWSFDPRGSCLTAGTKDSNTPDGNIVEKGAQAYKLRSISLPADRNVKTCSSSSCTALANFVTGNAYPAAIDLGATLTAAERDTLINWLRGQNSRNEDDELGVHAAITNAQMRPSIHADVVHSRPVAINYGSDASPSVVVFYGGNDGILRAVNGNRSTSIGAATAGSEMWSFVAPDFYTKIKRLYDNTTTISYPGHITGTPTPQPKDYGVDGPVAAYKSGTTAWIFATMRRGGKALYAFDVSTLSSDFNSPTLKWRNGPSDLTGLGQTWSAPKILKASGYGSGASPMLILGGGYDVCHDTDGNTQGCGTLGKKIYVLDADTGALLTSFDTNSSVVADLTIVNDDSTGMIKYAYAADLGGNVYRISGGANTPIGSTAPAAWTMTKIASFGGSGTSNRKFIFAPDVYIVDSGTYAVAVGSGDREKPLTTYTAAMAVENKFYAFHDKPTDSVWLSSENATCGGDVICNASLLSITAGSAPSTADLASKKGWSFTLAASEQVVTSAITVYGTIIFSTHKPAVYAVNTCTSTLGTATTYNITIDGSVTSFILPGGGLPPSPVAGKVTLDDGTTVPFVIGCGKSALEACDPPTPISAVRPKSRVYWYLEK